MARWWAAFFVAGLAAPGAFRAPFALWVLSCVLAASALCWKHSREGGIRAPVYERWRAGAVVYYLLTCAGGIVLGEEAACGRIAHEGTRRAVSYVTLRGAGEGKGGTPRSFRVQGSPADSGTFPALSGARERLLASLESGGLAPKSKGLVAALVLNERGDLDARLSDDYSYLGITHFLALSGLHLCAVAVPLARLLSFLIRYRALRDGALLALLALYSALAGFPASLLRALFLSAAIMGYRLIGMHVDLLGALFAGSFALLALEPAVAFDAGFQLSFSAVCAIAAVGIPLSRMAESKFPRGIAGTAAKAAVFPAIITCAVQFFTLPLVVSLFSRSSLLAPVVNILVSLPFTVLLYAGLAYVFIPLGAVRWLLAPPMNLVCRFLERVPGAFASRPHPGILHGDFNPALYLIGAGLFAFALRRKRGLRRLSLAAGALCIVCSFVAPRAPGVPPPLPRFGATGGGVRKPLIIEGRGSVCIAGERCLLFVGDSFTSWDAYRLARSLWRARIRSIDCCVVKPSGLRARHGLSHILARVAVKEVVCSPYLEAREPGLSAGIERMGIAVRIVSAGDSVECGPWILRIRSPAYPPRKGERVDRAAAALLAGLDAAAEGPVGPEAAGWREWGSIDPDRPRPPGEAAWGGSR